MACSERRRSRWGHAAALGTWVALAAGPARGAPDAVPQTPPALENAAPIERTTAFARASEIDQALRDDARRARRWRWAWIGINAGLTVSSFGSMPFVSRDRWPEAVVGGVGSAISTALTIAWPLDVEEAAAAPAPMAAPGAPQEDEERRALQSRAIAYGRDERDRLRWPWHLLNVGVGAAYLAILGFGYHHWESGAWAGASALVIGEAQTLTQPTGSTRFASLALTW